MFSRLLNSKKLAEDKENIFIQYGGWSVKIVCTLIANFLVLFNKKRFIWRSVERFRDGKECDAAKAMSDVPLLNRYDTTTFSLLVEYCHHDRQPEITDYLHDTASFSSRSIALSVGAGDVSCMEEYNCRVFDCFSHYVEKFVDLHIQVGTAEITRGREVEEEREWMN
ncbi:hypothetical protein EGR_09100 [Echinococcus granulosus]|uniref:Uncharacterized protein n=1 Tax=Echinococcus granulosus TaxID=6210 RepID=W6U4H7_ECHGR|nr:hypothetical protein EGR_09100 [Echinococcus granulosus]EUB56020.1 hypothetical protein EGR_09100 [Echinococcus granulosus]